MNNLCLKHKLIKIQYKNIVKCIKYNNILSWIISIVSIIWLTIFLTFLNFIIKAIKIIISFNLIKIIKLIAQMMKINLNNFYLFLSFWFFITVLLLLLLITFWFFCNKLRLNANNLRYLKLEKDVYFSKLEKKLKWTNLIMSLSLFCLFIPIFFQIYNFLRFKKLFIKMKI